VRALVFELQAELWYLSFKLSYRDLVAMMGERGIGLVHTTIPALGAALHPRVREALEPFPPNRRRLGAPV